jgi:hypothetical protein
LSPSSPPSIDGGSPRHYARRQNDAMTSRSDAIAGMEHRRGNATA